MKDYFKKLIAQKRNQITELEKAMVESEDREERAQLGDTLTKLRDELNEAEKMLADVEKQEEQQEKEKEKDEEQQENRAKDEARRKGMEMRGTYGMMGGVGMNAGIEERQKQELETLEKRGKELKEKRAVLVSSNEILLPKHTGNTLNDTFTPVSALVDQVASDNVQGGESYEEAYVKSYGTGAITEEGGQYADTDPEFDYAPMNKVKITAYAEISEEVKKLPNIDYARKVQESCEIALKKKLSQQIIAGTGTKQLFGITGTPKAIDADNDVEISAIDINTLNEAVFGYGGDEDVETQATLILNKKTLKELSEVKKANGDPAYDIDVANRTINTIPYTINSNLPDFEKASTGDFVMLYGSLKNYKAVTFSPVEIIESTDYKFKEGMICYKASVFMAGNVVMQDGFLRLKKK